MEQGAFPFTSAPLDPGDTTHARQVRRTPDRRHDAAPTHPSDQPGARPARRAPGARAGRRDRRTHRGLRVLRAADQLLAQRQAGHHEAVGVAAGAVPGQRLARHLPLLLRRRGLRAQGGPRVRLGGQRLLGAGPGVRRGLHGQAAGHRRGGQHRRPGPPDGHHVLHLERPDLLLLLRLQGAGVQVLRGPLQVRRHAAAPQPRAHLAEPGRRQRHDQLVHRIDDRARPADHARRRRRRRPLRW